MSLKFRRSTTSDNVGNMHLKQTVAGVYLTDV